MNLVNLWKCHTPELSTAPRICCCFLLYSITKVCKGFYQKGGFYINKYTYIYIYAHTDELFTAGAISPMCPRCIKMQQWTYLIGPLSRIDLHGGSLPSGQRLRQNTESVENQGNAISFAKVLPVLPPHSYWARY